MSNDNSFSQISYNNSKYCWNLFFISDYLSFGGRRYFQHPFLVIDVKNNYIFGFTCTHSKKVRREETFEIANTNLNDIDPATNKLRKTYMCLKPKYYAFKDSSRLLKINDLKNKVNTNQFTKEEINRILGFINTKTYIVDAYKEFKK